MTLVACDGCRGSLPVDSIEELPYPSCGEGPLPAGEVLAEGALAAGPNMRPQGVGERYALRRRGCLYVLTIHQVWPNAVADIEVVYDDTWLPLRVWKRMYPLNRPSGGQRADIRRYELRTQPATIRWRRPDGGMELRELIGARPIAVIASSRSSLLPWIRRAQLEVGEFDEGMVLDIRTAWDEIDDATLHRGPDREEASLGGRVHVHTLYGSQAFYTDHRGDLVGDLAGLMREDQVEGQPLEFPMHPMDPIGTP